MSDEKKIHRDESTPEAREIWRDVEKAAGRAKKLPELHSTICPSCEGAGIVPLECEAVTECACRQVMITDFENRFYVRHDHQYSGVVMLDWLRDVAPPCECARLRVALLSEQMDNERLRAALAAANESLRRICMTGVWGEGGVGSGSPSPMGMGQNALDQADRMETAIAKLRKDLAAANERAERAEKIGSAYVQNERSLHAAMVARWPHWGNPEGGIPMTDAGGYIALDGIALNLERQRDAARKDLADAVAMLRRNRRGYANILEFRKLSGGEWGQRDGYGGRYGALTREEIETAMAEIDPIVARFDAQGGKDA